MKKIGKEIKVWSINDDDCGYREFVAAKTKEQAIKFAIKRWLSCQGIINSANVRALTDEEMKEYDFCNANYKRERSFRSQLRNLIRDGEKFPCEFASEDW